jgi:hypothetical protein
MFGQRRKLGRVTLASVATLSRALALCPQFASSAASGGSAPHTRHTVPRMRRRSRCSRPCSCIDLRCLDLCAAICIASKLFHSFFPDKRSFCAIEAPMCSVLARALVRLKHLLQVCTCFESSYRTLLTIPAAQYPEQSNHAFVCRCRRVARQNDMYVD